MIVPGSMELEAPRHSYELWGSQYEGPIPQKIFLAPQSSQAFKILSSHFRATLDEEQRRYIIRRTLEVGINAAAGTSKPANSAYWERVETASAKACNALEMTLQSLWQGNAVLEKRPKMRPKPRFSADALLSTRQWRPSWILRSDGDETAAASLARSIRKSKQDVAILIAARSIAAKLQRDAGRRKTLTAKATSHVGSIARQNFARIMIEGWTTATGEAPTKWVRETSPVLSFIRAAWADWWEIDADAVAESFISQARSEGAKMSDDQIMKLKKTGPDWL